MDKSRLDELEPRECGYCGWVKAQDPERGKSCPKCMGYGWRPGKDGNDFLTFEELSSLISAARKLNALKEKLEDQAKKGIKVDYDDPEFSGVDNYAGGNIDDAYQLGFDDGATDFAVTLLKEVVGSGGQ